MMLMVTGVAGVIHIYSWGYMREDPGFSRYFACLSLFTFSMLGIVLASNFIELFIFWELVGVSSYLLIGFWYRAAGGGRRRQEGLPHQSPGRFRFPARHPLVWASLGSLNFGVLQAEPGCQPAGAGGAGDRCRPADLLRRGGQERPVPAARLAAGRDGRPDAGQRADSRRDDGGGGRLHALPGFFPARRAGAGGHCLDRRIHRACCPPSLPSSRTTSSASWPTRRSRNWATWSWRSACTARRRRCFT